jgi:hypothetical protein
MIYDLGGDSLVNKAGHRRSPLLMVISLLDVAANVVVDEPLLSGGGILKPWSILKGYEQAFAVPDVEYAVD